MGWDEGLGFRVHVNYCLNSLILKGGCIGDYIGDIIGEYYRGY